MELSSFEYCSWLVWLGGSESESVGGTTRKFSTLDLIFERRDIGTGTAEMLVAKYGECGGL